MPIRLRVARDDWIALWKHFQPSFRLRSGLETGALGVLGESRGRTTHEFLLAKVLWPEPGEVEMSHGGLVFSASYLRRAHFVMRAEGLAGLSPSTHIPGPIGTSASPPTTTAKTLSSLRTLSNSSRGPGS